MKKEIGIRLDNLPIVLFCILLGLVSKYRRRLGVYVNDGKVW